MSGHGYRIALEHVTYRTSRFADKAVLDGVDLHIEPGEFVALVGSNGAGKSTVLRALAGEIEVAGMVTVGGQEVDRPVNQIIDGVGVVHQDEGIDLIDGLTVAQNISIRQLLGTRKAGPFFVDTKTWRRHIAATLGAHSPVDYDLDEIVGNLNGGRKQMLAVTIAIHLEHERNPCRALLLDEHTSRLDHANAREIMEYTATQARTTAATTVMVTHRYSHAIAYADRIIVLRDGKIAGDFRATKFPNPETLASFIEGVAA